MKSAKQKAQHLKARRKQQKLATAKRIAKEENERKLRYISDAIRAGAVPVDPQKLQPTNSYSDPDFLKTGLYFDYNFNCKVCGKREVWTATQQKWWYEVAGGELSSTAIRCRACRRKERERKAEARRVHLEGIAKKKAQKAAKK
jgi:hypothetical protein